MGNRMSADGRHTNKAFSSPYQLQLETLFEKLSHNGVVMHKDRFEVHFEGPREGFSATLFNKIFKYHGNSVTEAQQKSLQYQNKASFIRSSHDLLEEAFKVRDAKIRFYFELMVGQDEETTLQEVKRLLCEACMYALVLTESDERHVISEDDDIIGSLAKSCFVDRSSVCKEKFCNWALDFNPKVFGGLEAWLHERFTGQSQKGHFHMLPLPDMTISEHSFAILTPSLLWYLCCVLPICYTRLEKAQQFNEASHSADGDDTHSYTWNVLYDSNEHGLSLNRFKNKCLNYPSPTVTLVKFVSGVLIAMALDQPWKDSSEKFGGSYSCLLEVLPNCRSILEQSNIFYLRESARSSAKGLLIGEGHSPKVKIETDLSSAEILYRGPQKEEILKIEVWGCGGVLAAAAQKKQAQWEMKEIEKMRKVKRPGHWDENPDKEILEMAGVRMSHSQRGDL